MAETEVESILREIRERVLSQQHGSQDVAATRVAMTNGGNGESNLSQPEGSEAFAAENLALINSYLTTTGRAWDRLPPLVSNRSGVIAQLELWLKRHLKRATRWYSWEQVNFNAAVHQALRHLLPLLSAHEQQLGRLRTQIGEGKALTAQLSKLHAELDAQRCATDYRFAELINEMRERAQHSLDEQRVWFKQLALEASEAAVLEDRARRKTEALLEDVQSRLADMERK